MQTHVCTDACQGSLGEKQGGGFSMSIRSRAGGGFTKVLMGSQVKLLGLIRLLPYDYLYLSTVSVSFSTILLSPLSLTLSTLYDNLFLSRACYHSLLSLSSRSHSLSFSVSLSLYSLTLSLRLM